MNPKTIVAIRLMSTNLHLELSVNDLARSVRLSRSRLCHLFTEELGVSPLKYLKALRMQKAREFLETSLLSIKEIAAALAYKDDSHFMRDFKKSYGMTPTQYRSQCVLLRAPKIREQAMAAKGISK